MAVAGAPKKYSISSTADTNNQTAAANQGFLEPLTARVVLDDPQNPEGQKDVRVRFVVNVPPETPEDDPPLLLNPDTGKFQRAVLRLTEGAGFASVKAKAGAKTGTYEVQARNEESSNSRALFTLTVDKDGNGDDSGKVERLIIFQGDEQSAAIGMAAFPTQLQVRALDKDNYGVDNAKVSFRVDGSTGTTFEGGKRDLTGIPTAGGGYTLPVKLVPGSVEDVFTVTATSNGKSAIFHLALLPEAKELRIELLPKLDEPIAIVAGKHRDDLKIRLTDADGREWPYVSFAASLPSALPMTFPGGDKKAGPLKTAEDNEAMLPRITADSHISATRSGNLRLEVTVPSGVGVTPVEIELAQTLP